MNTLKKNQSALSRAFGTRHSIFAILAVGLIIGFPSCRSQAEEGPDAIRMEISQYQAQINDLTMKINELDRQLEDMGERPRSRTRMPVTTIDVAPADFEQYFKASASVEAVRTAMISPETNGQIKEIPVTKGQRVRAGQVVARLNTQVLQNSMEEVKASLSLATTVYQRQKSLWEQQIGSEIQYLEARNAVESLETRLKTLDSQMDMAVMRAPFNGIVEDIFLREGELAMPGSRVMHIVNLEKLYINADVSESYMGNIRVGDNVILRFPAFPGQDLLVPVHRVGHVINPENRTFRVQLLIDNPGERYKPNMMASLGIVTYTSAAVLAVPSILIKQDVQGHYLYTAETSNGDLVARKVYVERGPDGEGRTMIKSGLSPGDQVIQNGHNLVTDGSLVRIENDANRLVRQ
jgi:membrane fusion protein, multidrug efflux system